MSLPLGSEPFNLCFWFFQERFALFNLKLNKFSPRLPPWEWWPDTIKTSAQRTGNTWSVHHMRIMGTAEPKRQEWLFFKSLPSDVWLESHIFSSLSYVTRVATSKVSFQKGFTQNQDHCYAQPLCCPTATEVSLSPGGPRQGWQRLHDGLRLMREQGHEMLVGINLVPKEENQAGIRACSGVSSILEWQDMVIYKFVLEKQTLRAEVAAQWVEWWTNPYRRSCALSLASH